MESAQQRNSGQYEVSDPAIFTMEEEEGSEASSLQGVELQGNSGHYEMSDVETLEVGAQGVSPKAMPPTGGDRGEVSSTTGLNTMARLQMKAKAAALYFLPIAPILVSLLF